MSERDICQRSVGDGFICAEPSYRILDGRGFCRLHWRGEVERIGRAEYHRKWRRRQLAQSGGECLSRRPIGTPTPDRTTPEAEP